MKYPKLIYVQHDENADERDDESLLAWEKAENANDGKVALYEFKGYKTKVTKVELTK